jgi:hypothetical protein
MARRASRRELRRKYVVKHSDTGRLCLRGEAAGPTWERGNLLFLSYEGFAVPRPDADFGAGGREPKILLLVANRAIILILEAM